MNIFEFLGVSEAITKDEAGNVYFAIGDCREYNDLQEVVGSDLVELDINNYFMTRESYEKYAEYTIEIDEGAKKFDAVRRPYYRMRGKPITEEQAFDIIRRTEVGDHWGIFCGLDEHEEYVGSLNFNNWVLPRNHYPKGYGWVHTDGTIGGNAITQKYPTVIEFVQEWLVNLMAFPYLDLVIAVTGWDEVPPEVGEC